jgi:thiol-disulfide isomerase/thioredoxin
MNLSRILGLWLALAAFAFPLCGETLPTLKVAGEVYTNVVVTSVTATDIYFTHAKGMGNAKLKKLDPELQRRFGFNSEKAMVAEQNQRSGNALFQAELRARKPAARPAAAEPDDSDDLVAPNPHAKSFRGQSPPQIFVSEWLTPAPNVEGKFVLVDFWATWCAPCRESIPHLNALAAKFKNDLVVIGLGNESPEEIQKMAGPRMQYSVGTDREARTMTTMKVEAIPHAILIDPKGIVRFEGNPGYLTEAALQKFVSKYGN